MPEGNIEVLRTPMGATAHERRRFEERLFLRLPRLYALTARAIWRRRDSRLRRALIQRVVRTSWEGFNRGDLDVVFLAYHPDCQSTFPPEMATLGLEPGTHALEERARFQHRVIDEWEEIRFEPHELIQIGDRLVSIGRMRFTGLRSGIPVETDWHALLTIRDGRVAREELFIDRAKALEAAGVAE
jgi:ketosteroid isomerase-like protein